MHTEITNAPDRKTGTTEERVKAVLEKVRPYVQTHGGDVWLVSIEGATVTLKIEGSCVGCRLANFTYNKVVKTLLMEEAPEITDVVLT
jgi:Fe-S cluster biogenesis protein NfuA